MLEVVSLCLDTSVRVCPPVLLEDAQHVCRQRNVDMRAGAALSMVPGSRSVNCAG